MLNIITEKSSNTICSGGSGAVAMIDDVRRGRPARDSAVVEWHRESGVFPAFRANIDHVAYRGALERDIGCRLAPEAASSLLPGTVYVYRIEVNT
ncbi:unnamed protein product, partial [Iphiclides podalirius]